MAAITEEFRKECDPCKLWLLTLAVALVATTYVAANQHRGWIPHDEGQLGQTALRILDGQLPHRDFVDPYTGGLGFLDALAFRTFGVHSMSLRWMTLPFFFGFVCCVFRLATRLAGTAGALLLTILIAALALPVYPAGMPSWYNLFFATYGTLALCRFRESEQQRWLWIAGVCCGLSILFKITGLYFLAASLLFIFDTTITASRGSSQRSCLFSTLVSVCLLAFALLASLFVHRGDPLPSVVHLILPYLAVVAYVARREWREGLGSFAERASITGKRLIPIVGGVALVLVPFLTVYAAHGALHALWEGVFVLPKRRMTGASMPFPSLQFMVLTLPWVALFLVGFRRDFGKFRSLPQWIALIGIGVLAVSHTGIGFALTYQSLRNLLPVSIAVGLVTLVHLERQQDRERDRSLLFLFLAVACFTSLIQFPYAGGFYFFYAAPISVLAIFQFMRLQPFAAPRAYAVVGIALVVFLVARIHFPGPALTGGPFRFDVPTAELGLPRSNLTVRRGDAMTYRTLVERVQSLTDKGDFILAYPDCPEVYFLADRHNPSRTMYAQFKESDGVSDSRLVSEQDIRLIVIKQDSEFSRSTEPSWLTSNGFRHMEEIVDSTSGASRFRIFWRDDCAFCADRIAQSE